MEIKSSLLAGILILAKPLLIFKSLRITRLANSISKIALICPKDADFLPSKYLDTVTQPSMTLFLGILFGNIISNSISSASLSDNSLEVFS